MNEDKHDPREPSPGKVGYKRPPVASQFKPGNKAAARRRPKPGAETYANTLDRLMLEPRRVQLRGKQVELPAFEVMIRRTMERAIDGDMRAVDRVLRYWDKFNFRPPHQEDTRDYGAEVRAKLQEMHIRMKAEKAANSGTTGTVIVGTGDGS